MKQIFTLLLFLCCCSLSAQQTCDMAIAIAPGTYDAFLVPGAAMPPVVCTTGPNQNPTRASWYKYTPSQNQAITVTTDLPGLPLIDTRVHIYTGTCGSLSCVAGDDDSGTGNTSFVSFNALANVSYYIVFDDNWSAANFSFKLSQTTSSSFMFTMQSIGSAGNYGVVDLNGDYLDDLIASTSTSGVGVRFQNPSGGFTSSTMPATGVSYTPSWSLAAGDFNKDGINDIMYGGSNGASVLLSNSSGTGFSGFNSSQYIFSQRTNFIDINNDGNLDAFVCHDVAPNCYFLNNGSGGFTFHQGGLGDYSSGGNYGSIWVDYDNDGDMDLFIAKCRGGNDAAAIDELHRNNGNGTFTNVAAAAGFADYHQSWSSAWADFDNDGDMDVLVGASSNVAGSHKLMRNNSDGTFTNVTGGSGYDTFTTLNVEHVAHDFDNDGYVDILSGGGKLMKNNGNMTFTPVAISAVNGPVGDLNDDGFLDIQNNNNIYLNAGNSNKWIKIYLQGIQSNRNGIGARIELYGAWGKQIREVRSGDGFRYMSSLNTHFGIGQATSITQLIIRWPSGIVDIINNPDVKKAHVIVEGASLSLQEHSAQDITLFPNPAEDIISVSANAKYNLTRYQIYDLNGKQIRMGAVEEAGIDVQGLAQGHYILLLQDEAGMLHKTRFIKK